MHQNCLGGASKQDACACSKQTGRRSANHCSDLQKFEFCVVRLLPMGLANCGVAVAFCGPAHSYFGMTSVDRQEKTFPNSARPFAQLFERDKSFLPFTERY
jgi:hypothetical protein